jgi:hypothetical protein
VKRLTGKSELSRGKLGMATTVRAHAGDSPQCRDSYLILALLATRTLCQFVAGNQLSAGGLSKIRQLAQPAWVASLKLPLDELPPVR